MSNCPPPTPSPDHSDFEAVTNAIMGMLSERNCTTGAASMTNNTQAGLGTVSNDFFMGGEFSDGCESIAALFSETYSVVSSQICSAKEASINITNNEYNSITFTIDSNANERCVNASFSLSGLSASVRMSSSIVADLQAQFTSESMAEITNAVVQDFANMVDSSTEGYGMESVNHAITTMQTVAENLSVAQDMQTAAVNVLHSSVNTVDYILRINGYCDVNLENITAEIATDMIMSTCLNASFSSLANAMIDAGVDTTVVQELVTENIGAVATSVAGSLGDLAILIGGCILLSAIAGAILYWARNRGKKEGQADKAGEGQADKAGEGQADQAGEGSE